MQRPSRARIKLSIAFRITLSLTTTLPLAALILPSACGSGSDIQLCGQIPGLGCPVGRGGTCTDVTCDALYDCVDGAWRLVESCPGGAGGGGGGAPDAGEMPDGCEKVAIDHTGEELGCTPDLQNPDCPAIAAETCVESACLTDCIDFFLCTKDGWSLAAYCTEEGQLVLTP